MLKKNDKSTMTSLYSQETRPLTVSELQQLNFNQLSLNDKIAIKARGRPMPDIQISQPGISNNKVYIRSFNSEWYQRKNWLCACEVRHALFCFPCLLFGGDVTWTEDGFRNISKLKEKTEKHESSKNHISNVVSLTLLEKVNIKKQFSESYRLAIMEHNRKVTKNRELLSKIIDCILFCGNYEIPLYDKNDDLVNSNLLKGLVSFTSKLDSDMKYYLETSTVFKDISKTIQNELLDCLLQIYHEEIKREIRQASFVAVMIDDTTDISDNNQSVIVLRYIFNEEIFERFWGFFSLENQTVDGISRTILEQLDIILQGNREKLIAQTYDGAIFTKGKKGQIQATIKANYSNAHFVHCYAHQINTILRNAASIAQNARIFFSNLMAIPIFFSKSSQRLSILQKHINIPHPSSANFDLSVDKIYENLQPLKNIICLKETVKNCLIEIQLTSNTDHTITEATGILQYIDNDEFMFWLEFFHQIMPHVEVIYNQMQSQEIDVSKINEYITKFKSAILDIRNSEYCANSSKMLTAEAEDVCDCICVDIVDRYSFTKHLVAAKLFDKKSFTSFKKKLPIEEITLTIEAYPMINKQRLETELRVFYNRSDMHEYCKLIDLLKVIVESNLDSVFNEMTKLLKILITIPMPTSETKSCFSTLKKMRTFLRSTASQERLNSLALITIEKNFFSDHPEIKEKVINLFAQNETRKDFIFKC